MPRWQRDHPSSQGALALVVKKKYCTSQDTDITKGADFNPKWPKRTNKKKWLPGWKVQLLQALLDSDIQTSNKILSLFIKSSAFFHVNFCYSQFLHFWWHSRLLPLQAYIQLVLQNQWIGRVSFPIILPKVLNLAHQACDMHLLLNHSLWSRRWHCQWTTYPPLLTKQGKWPGLLKPHELRTWIKNSRCCYQTKEKQMLSR